VPGGVIFEDAHTYVGHILPPELSDVYLGYLMVEPKRHVAGLGDLTDEEAADLGRVINDAARALKKSERAEHVYIVVLGDGAPHLHVHLIPRYPGTPGNYRGLTVRDWPGAPRGGAEAIAAVCHRVRSAMDVTPRDRPHTS
jgi:diadenosine tetraphosphate (Ap4A) HIT family hydrolase